MWNNSGNNGISYTVVAPVSNFFRGVRKHFRGKKWNKKCTLKYAIFAISYWNCFNNLKIWSNFNIFVVILGANKGGGWGQKYFFLGGGANSPCPPVPTKSGVSWFRKQPGIPDFFAWKSGNNSYRCWKKAEILCCEACCEALEKSLDIFLGPVDFFKTWNLPLE